MASIEKRGSSWRVRLFVNGIRESATFDTKKEAAAWALQREAEMTGKRLPDKTFGDALKRFGEEIAPTHRGAKWELVRLAKLSRDKIAKKLLANLTGPDLATWRDQRLKEVAPASVAREMNLLRSVLTAARVEWGWMRTTPLDGIKRPGGHIKRQRRVSDEELERLRLALGWPDDLPPENASQSIAVAMLFSVETALRSGELCSLEWPQVFAKERYIHLDKTKNGDTRNVPLSKRAAALLELLPRDGASVFGVDDAARDALFRKARDRTEIADLRWHDLRHEATTRLARKLDAMDLSRVTGHRDLRSLMTYYNPTASEIAERLG